MSLATFLAFIFLGSSLLSLWFNRSSKIWGTLVSLSLLSGLVAGNIDVIGFIFIIGLLLLWICYYRKPNVWIFIALICFSFGFYLRFIPGYHPFFFAPKFAIGLQKPFVGLFPLALIVPLASSASDWKSVFKGLIVGIAGIGFMALLAMMSGVVRWDSTLPSYMVLRTLSNLILTSIPEEGFFRGFVQRTLCDYFQNIKLGKFLALIITSILFSIGHIFWSPNLGILAFTFIASLLYGSVYLFSGKIESAMLCHFLLNFVHMTFFSYHAM